MGKFEQALAFGQMGESAISKWLQSRGHAVFPAYQVEHQTGKGPQLFAASGDLVLPDLLAFRAGEVRWFEAKHKTCFTWHRISRQWTTGIDLRHYGEYQEVAERTSLPVWLLFWHPKEQPSDNDLAFGCPAKCPTGLFGGDIAELTQCENHRSDRHGRTGMVYWAHSSLKRIAADISQQVTA
ncbi:MAG: hypothetical protein II336_17970 [Loktanella sp.]|nr:hypothetical protein [Loktanella sp.]